MEIYLIIIPIILGITLRVIYNKNVPIMADVSASILTLFVINVIATINIGYVDPFYAVATIYASPIPLILFLLMNIIFNYVRNREINVLKYIKIFAYSFFIQTIILFIIIYIVERVAQFLYE